MDVLRVSWSNWLAAALAGAAILVADPSATAPGADRKDKAPSPPAFRTAPVTRGDLVLTVAASGTLEPERIAEAGSQAAGIVTRLGPDPRAKTDPKYQGKSIDFGSPVEAGTVLAEIRNDRYVAQVEQARAGCRRAQAELAQAKAKLDLAEAQWRRAEELAKRNAIAASESDGLRSGLKVAQAAVAVAEAELLQSEAALKQAELELDATQVRSPVHGVVIDRRVNVGQTVAPDARAPALFLIASDLKKMQVWATVHEADVGRVREGQPVRFTVDARPGEVFAGRVHQVRLNATMTQNVVTYTVVVTTDNSDGKLLPYLTANVQFEVERRKGVLLVPNAALRWRPQPEWVAPDARRQLAPGEEGPQDPRERRRVWVQDGRYVRPLDVQAGATDGAKTEITGGNLEEGSRVIVGAAVVPTSAAREPAPAMEKIAASASVLRYIWGGSMASEKTAQRAAASMGTDLLLVNPGPPGSSGVSFGSGGVSSLTPQDADAIARECPAVVEVAPVVRARAQLVVGNRNWVPIQISGTTPSFLAVRDWGEVAEGSEFTDADVRNAIRVCLIGQTLKRELFGGESPVGKELRIRDVPFRVVGVLAAKGPNAMGMDQDDVVLAPWTTVRRLLAAQNADPRQPVPPVTVDQIVAKAASGGQVAEAADEITQVLRQRHRLRPGETDDFSIRDMNELTKALVRPFR